MIQLIRRGSRGLTHLVCYASQAATLIVWPAIIVFARLSSYKSSFCIFSSPPTVHPHLPLTTMALNAIEYPELSTSTALQLRVFADTHGFDVLGFSTATLVPQLALLKAQHDVTRAGTTEAFKDRTVAVAKAFLTSLGAVFAPKAIKADLLAAFEAFLTARTQAVTNLTAPAAAARAAGQTEKATAPKRSGAHLKLSALAAMVASTAEEGGSEYRAVGDTGHKWTTVETSGYYRKLAKQGMLVLAAAGAAEVGPDVPIDRGYLATHGYAVYWLKSVSVAACTAVMVAINHTEDWDEEEDLVESVGEELHWGSLGMVVSIEGGQLGAYYRARLLVTVPDASFVTETPSTAVKETKSLKEAGQYEMPCIFTGKLITSPTRTNMLERAAASRVYTRLAGSEVIARRGADPLSYDTAAIWLKISTHGEAWVNKRGAFVVTRIPGVTEWGVVSSLPIALKGAEALSAIGQGEWTAGGLSIADFTLVPLNLAAEGASRRLLSDAVVNFGSFLALVGGTAYENLASKLVWRLSKGDLCNHRWTTGYLVVLVDEVLDDFWLCMFEGMRKEFELLNAGHSMDISNEHTAAYLSSVLEGVEPDSHGYLLYKDRVERGAKGKVGMTDKKRSLSPTPFTPTFGQDKKTKSESPRVKFDASDVPTSSPDEDCAFHLFKSLGLVKNDKAKTPYTGCVKGADCPFAHRAGIMNLPRYARLAALTRVLGSPRHASHRDALLQQCKAGPA